MKLLIVVCVLSLIAVTYTTPTGKQGSSRGCIYILGKCQRECEEGTHAYALGCGNKVPEATCDEPNPIAEKAILCDYSACYCDPPTLRDKVSGKCVSPSDCPKKKE